MLYDIATNQLIDKIPHRESFDRSRGRITDEEFESIVDRINELIDKAGGEIATAGWLPGKDWTGTPFWPIYEKAAKRSPLQAGFFFGQLVWYAVMNRPEAWASGRYQKDGIDITSRTYFRINM